MQLHKIQVSNAPNQEQSFDFASIKIKLTLRFNSIGRHWVMDVFEPVAQRKVCSGLSLVAGVPLLMRNTVPYFFYLDDESSADLDPMTLDDLLTRCRLYVGLKRDIQQ